VNNKHKHDNKVKQVQYLQENKNIYFLSITNYWIVIDCHRISSTI